MANEITTSIGIVAAKGGATVNSTGTSAALSRTFDMTGTDMGSGTLTATSTPATLTPGSVTGNYTLILRNTGSATVRFGRTSATPITAIRSILPASREIALIVESGGSVYYDCDTSSTFAWWAVEE